MSTTTQRVAPDTQLPRVAGRARKATPGATPQSLEALRRQILVDLSNVRRQEARLAAMILIADRDRIGGRPIGEYLMHIQGIERQTVAAWLQNAKVNPWRAGEALTIEQVGAIVRQLIAFWKSGADL
jgi:hypothetical protein